MRVKIHPMREPHDTEGAQYYLHIDPVNRAVFSFPTVGNEAPEEYLYGLAVLVAINPELDKPALADVLKGHHSQAILDSIIDLYKGEVQDDDGVMIGTWDTGSADLIGKLKIHLDQYVPMSLETQGSH
jgi:hypothetical protein